jgi:hypothetical protein
MNAVRIIEMKKIIITGTAGFIGFHLINKLKMIPIM